MSKPLVVIAMGSESDLEKMRPAAEVLTELGVASELRVLSAHRTPDAMLAFGRGAADEGFKVIIAGAGGAAHLPGMLAAVTTLPVIGVPVSLKNLDGLDSLLSIVQMPKGVPVATVAIDGGRNAGILAARILALADPELRGRVEKAMEEQSAVARASDEKLRGLSS
ncbi:MAG TPA: 5-(carboxyamino)imidazole ribonucleotide mutase [Solirubrobacterales bacterium]|nr:5-(carboxyamino)imidazole ribonucleotide mutase [Solirubrobacterales bacterium]